MGLNLILTCRLLARHVLTPLTQNSAACGQRVFYVRGREAANALPNPDNPADAAIVGIVDEVRADAQPHAGGR